MTEVKERVLGEIQIYFEDIIEEKYLKKLKMVSLIGAIYEMSMGACMIFFIVPLFNLLGANITQLDYPMFAQSGGLLAVFIGLILLFSSFDIRRYLLNVLLITYLRFAIQIVLIWNILVVPELRVGLIIFSIMDLIFALITIFLIKKSRLTLNILKLSRQIIAY